MKSSTLLSFVLLVCATASYEASRLNVVKAQGLEQLTSTIDPDNHIYGIPMGTAELDFIKAYGNPVGHVDLTRERTAKIYGKSHAFIFHGGRLCGVFIHHHVLHWKLADAMVDSSPFDRIEWRLTNNIVEGLQLSTVRGILGARLSAGSYRCSFFTAKARVDLEFSRATYRQKPTAEDNDDAYRLRGLYIDTTAVHEPIEPEMVPGRPPRIQGFERSDRQPLPNEGRRLEDLIGFELNEIDVLQVIEVYKAMSGSDVDVDGAVTGITKTISVPSQRITRAEALRVLERAMQEQAGVILVHLTSNRLKATLDADSKER